MKSSRDIVAAAFERWANGDDSFYNILCRRCLMDHHRIFIAEKTIKEDGLSIKLYIVKPEKDAGHAICHPVHFYRLCEQKDQVEVLELNMQPDLQSFMAQRLGVTIEEFRASHVPMVSQPDKVKGINF